MHERYSEHASAEYPNTVKRLVSPEISDYVHVASFIAPLSSLPPPPLTPGRAWIIGKCPLQAATCSACAPSPLLLVTSAEAASSARATSCRHARAQNGL